MRRSKADKETLRMWQKKCERLEKENLKLKKELEAVEGYKDDYEELIASTKIMKEHYQNLIDNWTALYDDYKHELDLVLDTAKNVYEE